MHKDSSCNRAGFNDPSASCFSSEYARVQPSEDGRDEEKERSDDAGAQGGCSKQRQYCKRHGRTGEIDQDLELVCKIVIC